MRTYLASALVEAISDTGLANVSKFFKISGLIGGKLASACVYGSVTLAVEPS
jgi:hypothetical protein